MRRKIAIPWFLNNLPSGNASFIVCLTLTLLQVLVPFFFFFFYIPLCVLVLKVSFQPVLNLGLKKYLFTYPKTCFTKIAAAKLPDPACAWVTNEGGEPIDIFAKSAPCGASCSDRFLRWVSIPSRDLTSGFHSIPGRTLEWRFIKTDSLYRVKGVP